MVGASLVPSAQPAVERSKRNVNFLATCRLDHTSNDDPVVHPGHRGRSHEHAFFGNTSTNAYATLKSLRAARTTCTRPDETAAYWVPTLFKNGRRVRPSLATAYPIYDGRNVELSSGGQHTGHADFFNAWRQEELRRIVAACTRGLPRCAQK